MESLTIKGAEKYIIDNYGKPRHNVRSIVKACKHLGKNTKLNPLDLFFLLIENRPIGVSHSYGFHTAWGRYLIKTLQSLYYQFDRGFTEDEIIIFDE